MTVDTPFFLASVTKLYIATIVLRLAEEGTLEVDGPIGPLLPPELAGSMTRAIPDCRLVTVEGAGHSVPLDQPERFAAVVRTFLSSD